MKSGDVAQELAAAVGLTLPAEYIAFLDGLAARRAVTPEMEEPYLEFEGRTWNPYDRGQMAEPVRYNRDAAHPRAHETRCIAQDLRAMDATSDGEASSLLAEQGVPLESLDRCFCIGDDGNGEPVFVHPDTGAVFVYYHDGMDLERWADSLVEFLAGSADRIVEEGE